MRFTSNGSIQFILYSLGAQAIGYAVAVGLASTSSFSGISPLIFHGITSFLVARLAKLPLSWQVLNLALPVAIYLETILNIPQMLTSVLLVLSVIMFLPTVWTRVPFYPTNPAMYEKVLAELPIDKRFKFIDLGSGFAPILSYLASRRPNGEFEGVELGPLPYVVSKTRFLIFGPRNVRINYKNLWSVNLGDYDVVYCFLAPPPMEAIWQKVKREMKPGTTFMTNSFPVPDKPTRTASIESDRQSTLFIHSM